MYTIFALKLRLFFGFFNLGNVMFEFITFSIDEHLFALPLNQLSKAIRAVAVTHVPDSDEVIHGVFDYHGEVLPVINLRKRFSLPLKKINVSDHFLIFHTEKHSFAIVVDHVNEIKKITQHDISEIELLSPAIEKIKKTDSNLKSFMRTENGIIIIYDLELLINSDLEIQLEQLTEMLKEEESK